MENVGSDGGIMESEVRDCQMLGNQLMVPSCHGVVIDVGQPL